MKQYIYKIYIVGIILACTTAKAQVTVDTKIDHTQIVIGQETNITLEVSADKGQTVTMPTYEPHQEMLPGIEVSKTTDADTTWLNEGKRMVLSRRYTITSFDSAFYYIPPMQVKVDENVFEAGQNLALKVLTIDIDTTKVDEIFPIKPEMAPPFQWAEWRNPLLWSLLLVVLALILVYVVIRLKDNKPIIRHIRLKPRMAPHKAALMKINQIKTERSKLLTDLTEPRTKETTKAYYTQLTDTLRQYIFERYGFNAMEMTTPEIIAKLQNVNDEEAIGELRELFETADLVKFAKYDTQMNEDDRNLVSAIEYINSTKQEEVAEQMQQELIVMEKGSKRTRTLLIVFTSLLAIGLLATLGYIAFRLMNLLM